MNGKIYTMEADGTIFPSVWYLNFNSNSGRVHTIDFSTNDRGMFNVSTAGNVNATQKLIKY